MIRALTSTYAGRRVLVTGHSGFKGGWLMDMLAALGAQPMGFGLPSAYAPDLGTVLSLATRYPCASGDVLDLAALAAAVETFRPDLIVHMAAQPLVRLSYDRPAETFAVNVQGTVHVLEAARQAGTPAVVVVTSDKVYRNDGMGRAFVESDPLGGHDPYSASKAAAEQVAASYRASYFSGGRTLLATVRAGNIIGGGDWSADRLVPDFCRATYQRQEPLVIRNPQATRPWQHALDALTGYLLVGAGLLNAEADAADAWNFGPDAAGVLTVREIVDRCIACAGRGGVLVVPDSCKPEARRLALDTTAARTRFGWAPRLTADHAVALTLDWYRSFHHPAADTPAMIRLTRAMVDRHLAELPSSPFAADQRRAVSMR